MKYGIIRKTNLFIKLLFKGLGQIMLQENAFTGFLFLAGIFYGSIVMGLAALLATLCGTVTALLLKYDSKSINSGVYGFSAGLVGVALMLFLKPVILTWIFIIIGASIAAIVQEFFLKRNKAVFTLPFVLVTWIILLFSPTFLAQTFSDNTTSIAANLDYYTLGFKGFGQVIFQGNLISGLLFFLAVFIHAPISALYGLAAGILSAIIAFEFSIAIADINNGLLSYNAILCAMVFAGPKLKDALSILIAVLLSFVVSYLFIKLKIIPLTFPFVLGSFLTIQLKNRRRFIMKKGV